ncbi:MAG TPA: formate transporter FocA [Longimicrobiales bacterium]|nr:formate transporter FocA [Longimicrobiales bacterium]
MTTRQGIQAPVFDALLPADMAARAEQIGVRKAGMDWLSTFVLAVLAGAFIAVGAMFATTVTAGSGDMPYGVVRLLAGVVFSLGLILVIVGGAELFTGNTLIVMAWDDRMVTTGQVLRNWTLVYLGNFVGAIGTVLLVFLGEQYRFGDGAVGAAALAGAHAKVQLGFVQAIALGTLCNALVCLAVWLTFSARTTTDRILAILFPITAFVAAGFEHSVANMYFIPIALLIREAAPPEFWAAIGRSAADYPELTWSGFLGRNLLPVTIGNIIGGAVLVGTVYRLVYLRPRAPAPPSTAAQSAEPAAAAPSPAALAGSPPAPTAD